MSTGSQPVARPRRRSTRRPAYPRGWEADVVLSDGGTVHIRPVVPEDADGLVAFHGGLSDRTRYLRYFGPYPVIPPRDLERFSVVDHHDRVALAAVLGSDIIAVGRYERIDDTPTAEVAFVVADMHQSRGLGSILLEHLAAAARERGLTTFVAEVLAENGQMVRVFRDAGYQVSRELDAGVVHLRFDLDPTERSVAVARAREERAEARSVHNLLHPTSIAVIGASADRTKVGYAVLSNLIAGDFAGPVYPVNPHHRSVRGVPAFASVTDIPDSVDLAVVAVPATDVDAVLAACLDKGVRTLMVISAGFGERGRDGRAAEEGMVTRARVHGMRVVGPNALGVLNTDPAVRLNATLAPTVPGRGRAGFFCQSGALGSAILADASARGLGLTTFVSAGNRADVSGNDLLQYWASDDATEVVLLYLESFGNPRKFARLARRLGREKPVVAVRGGRHRVLPALASTAAALDAASEQALFEQAGVIRVDTLAELFDTALLLAHQPLPTGSRVAVVGNSSAIGVLAADTALAQGLELAGDPVDVGAAADPEVFAAAVGAALRRSGVDALVVVFVPPLAVPGADFARALRRVIDGESAATTVPIVSTFLGVEGVPEELAIRSGGAPDRGSVPSYPSPERAVHALARVIRYAAWRARPRGVVVSPPVDRAAAESIVDGAMARARHEVVLSDEETVALLDSHGIEVVPFLRVSTVEGAVDAAAVLGLPVTVKVVPTGVYDHADLAGIRLDLASPDAVRAAYLDLAGGRTGELYVQRMAPKGVPCVIGLQDDPSFGTLISFGLGGVVSELLGDWAYRAVPLTDTDVADLVRAPRAAPLLAGYRGGEPVDLAKLERLIAAVAAMGEHLPKVRSLTLGPILGSADGVFVTGARISVGEPPARPDTGPRRLSRS